MYENINRRRKIASWFGRREHFFGELLGVVLLADVVYGHRLASGGEFLVWLSYFISHRLEKFFYGRFGPRSL